MVDGDCSNEIKRPLILGRKVMTNLDSILKSRDIICQQRPISQSYGFSSIHIWMLELDYKENWALKNWCFWTFLESPLDGKEIKPANLKGSQPCIFIERTNAEAETPVLWWPDAKNWLIGKDPEAGKDWRQKEKGMTENETVGWHHWLNRHEFEQSLGAGVGQGNLACCSPWGCKESDMAEWTELNWIENEKRKEQFSITVGNTQPIGFPGGSDGKKSTCNAGDPVQFLGCEGPLEKEIAALSIILAWRIPWMVNFPLFLPGKLMDRGICWATVHGFAKSWIQLSDWEFIGEPSCVMGLLCRKYQFVIHVIKKKLNQNIT